MPPRRPIRSRRVATTATSTTAAAREEETAGEVTANDLSVSTDTLLLTLLTELHDEIRNYLTATTDPTAVDPAMLAQWRTRVRAFANRSATTQFLFPALRPFLQVGSTVQELTTLRDILHRTLTTRLDIPSVQSRLLTLLQEGETSARTRERVSRNQAVETIVQQSTTTTNQSADDVRQRLSHLTTSDVLLVAAVRQLVAQQTREGVLWSVEEWRKHLVPLHPSFRLLIDVQPFDEMRQRARFSPWGESAAARGGASSSDATLSAHATLVLAGLPLPPRTLLQFAQTTLLFPSVDIAVRHFATQHRLDGFWDHLQTHGPQDLVAWSRLLGWPIQTDTFFRGRGPFRHRVFPWRDLLTLPIEDWARLMANPFTRASPDATAAFVRRSSLSHRPAKTLRRTSKTTTGRRPHVTADVVVEEEEDTMSDDDASDIAYEDLEALLPRSEQENDDDTLETHANEEEEHGDALTWLRHVMEQQEQEVADVADTAATTTIPSTREMDNAPIRLVLRLPDGRAQVFRVPPKTVLRAILMVALQRAGLPLPRGSRRHYVLKQRDVPLRLERTVRDLHLVSGTVLTLDTAVQPALYAGPAVKSLVTRKWHGRVRLGWRILLLQTRPWIPHYHYSLLVPKTVEQATRFCVPTGVVGQPCHLSAAFFRLVAETPWEQQQQSGQTFHCGANAFEIIHVLTDGSRVVQTPTIFEAEKEWCANELHRFLATPYRHRMTLDRVGEQPFASLDTDTAAALLALLRHQVEACLERWMPSRNVRALVDAICASTRIDGSILDAVRETAALLVWIDPASPVVGACPTMRARLVNYALQLDRLLPLCASGPSRRLWSFVFPEFWDFSTTMRGAVSTLLQEWVRSKALQLWAKFNSENGVHATSSMLATHVLLSTIKVPEPSSALRQALLNVGRQPPSTRFPVAFVDTSVDALPRQSEDVSALAERWMNDDRRQDLPMEFATFFDCVFAQYGGGVDDTWAAFEDDPFPVLQTTALTTTMTRTVDEETFRETYPVQPFRPDFFTVMRAEIVKRKALST